jgi:NaMN:DMB phosphoribosyltransferase
MIPTSAAAKLNQQEIEMPSKEESIPEMVERVAAKLRHKGQMLDDPIASLEAIYERMTAKVVGSAAEAQQAAILKLTIRQIKAVRDELG